ncbi:diphosphate--fructose-6-phosphate 1-phosphotransferase [Enorma burkinafasonensis]|uniref:diphosphate--fructose-6-phosphate 1-phosphotransferase n=1 Tax=Enorma burkinafasonensis TaxID=2590867 RepID=UPI00119E49E3|nr:diphosphate--fructose-6-phosphate 1-phosphotransferase [Enorma burkinafasonensis]
MATQGDNLLVIHGGGPTAVINASLYGAVRTALGAPGVGAVLGARGGVAGLAAGDFVDFRAVPESDLALLPSTPSSAIGTGRDAVDEEGYRRLAEAIARHGIRWVLMTGGNGSMDTCGKIYHACCEAGVDVGVMGIPKTMDNDIAVTDHAPGFGSAARFVAQTTSEVCCDVKGLPIHIVVLEVMGRSAGWVAASSALAADAGIAGPDLIYMPERAFNEDEFLADVQALIDEKRSGVVVASEGLHYADGTPIVEPVMTVGRATYFGDVSAHLANLIIKKLGYKARSEKPGLVGRASIAYQSSVDRDEAIRAGSEAVRAALEGDSGKMIGFEREGGADYAVRCVRIPIEQVMLDEQHLPDEFINERGNGVTEAFRTWCRPLIGEPLPRLVSFA